MGIFFKKRTVASSLVCLFCPEVNPSWFTKENLDAIPVCTSCHLHLVPDSFKQVLISGSCPEDLQVDKAAGLAAAMSAMTMLWASVNSIGVPIVAKSPVSWDVWNPETFDEWPMLSQSCFLSTFEEGAFLESPQLGNFSDQMPFVASMSSNLLWRISEDPDETVVTLWPKESLALVSAGNLQAIKGYLEIVRPSIPVLEIWQLIDRLFGLIEKNPHLMSAKRLFGFNVVLQTFTELPLREAKDLSEHEDFASRNQMTIKPGSKIDPFGNDLAKRLYTKSDARLDFELFGPFGLTASVEDSDIYDHHSYGYQNVKVIHAFSFKVLASGVSEDQAQTLVEEKLLEKFGFVVKRNGQNWLVDKKRGVDFFENHSEDVHESQLYSKVIEVRPSSPSDWIGTAWQLRCS
jgi:hypothetical protein